MADFAEFFSPEPNPRNWNTVPPKDSSNDSSKDSKDQDLNYSKLPNTSNYDMLKKPLPSDTTANKLKKNMEDSKKEIVSRKKIDSGKKINKKKNTISNEIKMIELKTEKCSNKEYPYLKTFFGRDYCVKDNKKHIQESLNEKEFCYLDDNIHPELVKYYAKHNIQQCNPKKKNSKDQLKNKSPQEVNKNPNINNQNVTDYISINENRGRYESQKPINIYMSCNNNVDEKGYEDLTIYEKCLNKKGKIYKDTLTDYYRDQSSGDNVYLRRRRWRDSHINNRDFYRELENLNIRPNMSLTQPDSLYKENIMGGNVSNKMGNVKGYNLYE